MINRNTYAMAWSLLDKRERRNFWIVLFIIIVAAISSSIMVGSVMPFLAVVADPEKIYKTHSLNELYKFSGAKNSNEFLVMIGLGSIVIIIISNAIQIFKTYLVTRYSFMRAHTISSRLISITMKRPYSYFLDNNMGDLGAIILSESQQIVVQFYRPALEVLSALATIVALVGLLLYIDPKISFIAFLVLGSIYGGALLPTRRKLRRMGDERAQTNAERFRVAGEALDGIRDIRLLGRERAYLERYHAPSLKMAQSMANVAAMGQTPQYIMHAATFGGLVILCLVMLAGQREGGISQMLPTIGLIAFAGQRLLPELAKFYQNLTQLVSSDAAVRTVYSSMVSQYDLIELPPVQSVSPLGLKKELSFESVTYQYKENNNAGLNNISFHITAGERIGVMGSTGAGKTTLANILLGLMFPTSGDVRVDGVKISPETVRGWQRSIGYVPQEIFLTDASVRENIALGLPPHQIDDVRVRRAAEVAQIHDFIMCGMDRGYDTLVGERGVRLSGGQRQRIGIARALYEDADFILLDEATSALDNETEAEVIRAIEALPGNKTIVMIAHRLTTLRNCDRIFVMKSGNIAQIGRWDEIIT